VMVNSIWMTGTLCFVSKTRFSRWSFLLRFELSCADSTFTPRCTNSCSAETRPPSRTCSKSAPPIQLDKSMVQTTTTHLFSRVTRSGHSRCC
jgi:hypothetical protein